MRLSAVSQFSVNRTTVEITAAFFLVSILAPFRSLPLQNIYVFTAKLMNYIRISLCRNTQILGACTLEKTINRNCEPDSLSDGVRDHGVNTNTLGLIQILLEADRMIQRMKKALEIERGTCLH